MKIYRTKSVTRFSWRERVSDNSLKAAIYRAEKGSIDADLGGGLIKQRVPRVGQGRSSGFRMIVAYRAENRAVFLFGFAKNDLENISSGELQALRKLGAAWLSASCEKLEEAIHSGDLQEIDDG